MSKTNGKYKKRILNAIIILILLLGVGVVSYPFFSNWYNQRIQDQLIEGYDTAVAALTEEEKQAELDACRIFNQGLRGNVILRDPFDPEQETISAEEYEKRLNINGNGIMGYIEIPRIDVKLNIYHGTTAEVLDQGAGHLENTSLPVGGKGTHAVLSAHTAYAKATLFNDLIDLEERDIFYLTVLDDKLAYQVDQIRVVEPWDTKDLKIHENEDYVTLITCTPYGVNSHRLLVRGVRVPYTEIPAAQETDSRPDVTAVIAAISGAVVLTGVLFAAGKRRRRRKRYEKKNN